MDKYLKIAMYGDREIIGSPQKKLVIMRPES